MEIIGRETSAELFFNGIEINENVAHPLKFNQRKTIANVNIVHIILRGRNSVNQMIGSAGISITPMKLHT